MLPSAWALLVAVGRYDAPEASPSTLLGSCWDTSGALALWGTVGVVSEWFGSPFTGINPWQKNICFGGFQCVATFENYNNSKHYTKNNHKRNTRTRCDDSDIGTLCCGFWMFVKINKILKHLTTEGYCQ
jgi:hypothetical protein